jgi:hypothetical protein
MRRLDKGRDRDTAATRRVFVERYEEVIVEAWEGWDASKADKERKTAELITSGGAKRERSKSVKIVEGRLADPEYLRVIIEATDKQAEMEDVKPPRRVAGPGGDFGDIIPITIIEPVRPEPG